MEAFAVTPVVFGLWLCCALISLSAAYSFTILMLPFGMMAVLILPKLGGLSFLAVNMTAALTVGVMTIDLAARLLRGEKLQTPAQTLMIGAYGAYSLLSATLLVRLFEGDFAVFSLGRAANGVKVSVHFNSVVSPLSSGNSNLSQATYVLLSCAFFVASCAILRRRGVAFGDRLLRAVALINFALGMLDMLRFDKLMEPIRTATYALANEQTSAGMSRVIGGFPEPSAFGPFSVVLFAYFAGAFIGSGRGKDALFALLSLSMAIASLAASAFLAIAAASVVLGWQVLARASDAFERRATLFMLISVCAVVALLCVVLMSPIAELGERVINEVIFQKADSTSGLERGAWAAGGITAFYETYGLGAGVGSLRSNGLASVVLGSVGIPGALALAAFFIASFVGTLPQGSAGGPRRVYRGAQAAASAQIAALFVSGTVPDPGMLTMFLAALAITAKRECLASVAEPKRMPKPPIGPQALAWRG
ncbi:hypothetical protein [Consotaella salsifontis]|uniref:O-Antigen ligase n=1 Tax=Consotaella salsifontis TaxID=1365950 RepID=A0A1T4SXR5_9HYPH|nr:hypothetical protein [Consotaella salsifontis]SKA33003.1 hypothetical protein SAMN05428963_11587 [Consotaella salsifontis]